MPQCNQSSTGGVHTYEPDRHVLSRVTCLHCGHTKLCTKSKCITKYLRCRRATQRARGLLDVVVPFDGPSASLLADVLSSCYIKSDASTSNGSATVTLLEGFLPQSMEAEADIVEALRRTLLANPTVTFRKLRKVRRTDKSKSNDLLIANVSLHPTVSSSSEAATTSDRCVLPQYPAHVVLGAASREGRISVNALKRVRAMLQGQTLTVDAAGLKWAGIADRHRPAAAVSIKYQHLRQPSADETTLSTCPSDPDTSFTSSSSEVEVHLSSSSSEKVGDKRNRDTVAVDYIRRRESDILLNIDLTFLDSFHDDDDHGDAGVGVEAVPSKQHDQIGCYGYNTQQSSTPTGALHHQFHGAAAAGHQGFHHHFGAAFTPPGMNFGAAR